MTAVIPVVSAAALAMLTVFNIGYFSKVGIHFLGVVDLTNLVYSFGLAFGAIALIFSFIGFDSFDYAGKRTLDYKKMMGVTLAFKCAGGALFSVAFVAMFSEWKFFGTDAFLSFAAFICALSFGLHGYARFKAEGRALPSDYLLPVAILALCITYAGRAVAESQLTSDYTYTITTKDASLKNIRIIRTSSMGFLIAIDRLISFVPSSEVKRIQSDLPAR